jgi:hypothetical protein
MQSNALVLPWEVKDVSSWPAVGEEVRGRRSKLWLEAPDGSRWLRKSPAGSRPFEPAVEALMLRLGQEVGLSAPDSYVCTWVEHDAVSRGLVVRLFLDNRQEELSLASALFTQRDQAYDAKSRWMQTLPRVREALTAIGVPRLLEDFTRLMAFDAWIGNADRHQENWGVVTPIAGTARLAPMFDPASCLGAELQEGNKHFSDSATPEMMKTYLGLCGSGFGNGRAGILLSAVVEELKFWPEWNSSAASLVAEAPRAMDTLQGFLTVVPSLWLPEHRKRFMLELLQLRLNWLQSLL